MKFVAILFCVLFLNFSSQKVYARVFDFKSNWVAAYIRGTGGPSMVHDDAYRSTSGNSTTFTDEVAYNFSGEFGFSFLFEDHFVLRAGIEGLQSKNISARGKDSNGGTLMDVDSKVTAFNPVLTGELFFKNTGTSRFLIFGGAGYATVKVQNSYSNVDNMATYIGAPASYNDNWNGTGISYHGGAGWEVLLFDNTTFSIEGGYRVLAVDKFKYDADATVIRGTTFTSVTKGSTVLDNNGGKSAMSLSGYFVAISFKFYIPPLK